MPETLGNIVGSFFFIGFVYYVTFKKELQAAGT